MSLFILCIIFVYLPVTSCTRCMSATGNPVDWFMVYKVPEIDSSDPNLRHGYGHFYMDVDNPTWTLSKISMNDSQHAVAYTLQPIYKSNKNPDFMYLMYNDEDPNKKEPRAVGHSKGVLAFDKTSGFWMVHSTPRFPPFKPDGYMWPHTATRYGQSFLCVSYPYSQLDVVAKQIVFNYVFVYDKWAPDSFLSENPNLAKVVKHYHLTSPPWTSIVTLTSIQGRKFTSFAKTAEFNEELYADLVAPTLNSSLKTETWQNGRGKLPSNCSGIYKVYNVKEIRLSNNVKFDETKDHSKWAITLPSKQWVCVGDINRQQHQEKRGGGTVCLQNGNVWNNFLKSIEDYEKCP